MAMPATNDEVKTTFLDIMPYLRVNHRTHAVPAGPAPPANLYRIAMRTSCSQSVRLCFAVAFLFSTFALTPRYAQPQGEKAPAADKGAPEKPAEKTTFPPLPADAHVQQEIKFEGK